MALNTHQLFNTTTIYTKLDTVEVKAPEVNVASVNNSASSVKKCEYIHEEDFFDILGDIFIEAGKKIKSIGESLDRKAYECAAKIVEENERKKREALLNSTSQQ